MKKHRRGLGDAGRRHSHRRAHSGAPRGSGLGGVFEEVMGENSPNLVKLRNQFNYNRNKRNKTLRSKFNCISKNTIEKVEG